MEPQEAREEMEEISLHLQKEGLPPGASADERQCHLWRLLVQSEGSLARATEELQALRMQQANEMKEVENYVEHIRNMLEERESLTAEYERDNEQLRAELAQMKYQQDSQCKEVAEMLDQEGLAEISHSSPSEQVAYLLVERVTLLERLEAAERKLDTQTLTGNLREVHLQEELDHMRHTMEEELRQQKETMQRTKDSMNKDSPVQSPWKKLFGVRRFTQSGVAAHSEELSKERMERQKLERDLTEASSRLTMAHKEIRHLTDELDSIRKAQLSCGPDLHRTGEEVQLLKQEVDKLKQCDMVELQRARERNDRLDGEIRALRDRVRSLDMENKTLLEMVENSKVHSSHKAMIMGVHDQSAQDDANDSPHVGPDEPLTEEQELHKRCRQESEDKDCRLREIQRKLQKLQKEHEELVERNEELESLLGETQNASREERERHECEVEGLQRKIKSMEGDLNKMNALKSVLKGEDQGKDTELKGGSLQERVAFLEGRLTEEKVWRKQLEIDLTTAQTSLKTDREALQKDHEELKRLRLELQRLQAECREGKSLHQTLTQIKGEKGILEEKVAQLERAQTRLQGDLVHQTENSQVQEDLRESRRQVAELKAQVEQLTSELSRLEKEHSTLRDEMVEKRRQLMDMQGELSQRVQEQLQAEGEKDRANLELLYVREQLQQTWQETQRPKQERTPDSQPFSTDGEGLSQLASLKMEMSRLHSTLEEERKLASQHQLALQAQINEAQARAKAQDSVLQQKAEENKQLKHDMQRTQHLFTSAERELRYEREKNLDLKRHNALLDQEKIKLCAELKQSQAKLSQLEQTGAKQAVELEQLQQKTRELELELARIGQSHQTTSSLKEELNAERARVIAADKKVLELQKQLKTTQHQLRLEEARAGETTKLERDARDMSDNLSALRARLQEEHLQRKLVEQREEELQQQLRALRVKEATLTRTNSELCHRMQQLETRLEVLESELRTSKEEERLSQQTCHRLEEQLASSQQESEKLQQELQQVVQQLDTNIRKYNEKQSQHKIKLRRAKQVFVKAVTQRDRKIEKLESDLALATSLSEKEKDWIKTVTEQNEQLLLERRELLKRMSEAEEMGNNGMQTASTIQQRVNYLEMENRQLQDKTLKLANEVGVLDRALRSLQSMGGVEDIKRMFPSGSPEGLLRNSVPSPKPGLSESLGILDAIRRVKVGDHVKSLDSSLSVPLSQSFEIGYLNVTSPVAHHEAQDHEESLSAASDEA
ncbi:coiled-coil domain-containing protein 30 [Chanos chanos]|uniref:Coiled-coil domain-containing protein 30 n=1 Tax=Chanos chanos TaxID=29144 RepID=A0A6J2UX03_CHACN|nr:coiled-coil domain-containing protein 30-like [Chanos chanos]